jgi:hypothetical protein
MDMDIWYELRLREMSGLNERVNELLREAREALGAPDTTPDAAEDDEE